MPPESHWPDHLPSTLLVGAGVVGTAIAQAHLDRNVAFCIADQNARPIESLRQAWVRRGVPVADADLSLDQLTVLRVGGPSDDTARCPIVIESIVEQADPKIELFQSLQRQLGSQAVLCSNTSTLQIGTLAADALSWPGRVCGMHFFMPVHARAAVEIIAGKSTDPEAIAVATDHAHRIGKQTIRCQDGPGFIVNRMLSPYLNQSLWLLCRGATEPQIARAARAYGMPLSPLELIDWIGIPTMYHAGKAFWSAFPQRIEPSPLIPALLKRKRLGRVALSGLYDYEGGDHCEPIRSRQLSLEAMTLIESYQKDVREFTDGEVLELLSIPMWIEATLLLREGIADSLATVDLAMAGGLGYNSDVTWSGFFEELGLERINDAVARHSDQWKSMRIPQ